MSAIKKINGVNLGRSLIYRSTYCSKLFGHFLNYVEY